MMIRSVNIQSDHACHILEHGETLGWSIYITYSPAYWHPTMNITVNRFNTQNILSHKRQMDESK